MVTQGRSGRVEKAQVGETSYYLKRNEDTRITDLEMRMYTALHSDSLLCELGVNIPTVIAGPENGSFYVEDCGPTFADHLNSGRGIADLSDVSYVSQLLGIRREVSRVVNSTLTLSDKSYLTSRARGQLRVRTVQLLDNEVSDAELEKHIWAYRVMGALGVTDSIFKELYSLTVGSLLDTNIEKYGAWLTDNCVRNNAIGKDGVGTIPFDFNSLRYGLKQMDEGAILGMYLFPGPLALSTSSRAELIQLVCGPVDSTTHREYYNSLMGSLFHTHAMLAGYRTADAKSIFTQLSCDVKNGIIELRGSEFLERYTVFRSAWDEVDYHSSIVNFVARFDAASFGSGKVRELNQVARVVCGATFGTRVFYMMHPLFQVGDEILWRSRTVGN